jgi:hypothetical protein
MTDPTDVRVTRIDIPIGDLAVFWLKLLVAAIPAWLLARLVYALLGSLR